MNEEYHNFLLQQFLSGDEWDLQIPFDVMTQYGKKLVLFYNDWKVECEEHSDALLWSQERVHARYLSQKMRNLIRDCEEEYGIELRIVETPSGRPLVQGRFTEAEIARRKNQG